MQFSLRPVGTIILLWVGLMFLLLFQLFFVDNEILSFLSTGYMLVVSFSLTKLEKRSITERFGFQRNNVFGLIIVICLGLIVVYFFYDFNINNLDLIVVAPLVEEIFFRGLMLGILCKRNYKEWRRIPIEYLWIPFTSLLFALGHVLRYYPAFPPSMWNQIYLIMIGSLIHGLLYVWFRTILWSVSVHMLHNSYPPIRNPKVIISLIVFFASLVYAVLERSRKIDTYACMPIPQS